MKLQPFAVACLLGAAGAPAQADATEPVAAAASSPAQADGAPVRSLGVVVVSGSQPTSLPTHIPATIETVMAPQIAEAINATDSGDVLKYLPSLLVRKRYIGDYNHAVLSTRASGTGNSARSLVYADGVLLSNLLGNGASFAPRWGLVAPEEIERVDVLYGPFSAAYPGNAVGAVVDYRTRMPRRFEAHAKLSVFTQPFDLYGTHDTYGGRHASASLGNRSEAWSWWFHLSRLDSRGQPLVFSTRLVSQGTPGSEGVPVAGAVEALNRQGQPWYVLGNSAQYHTVQDQAKLKLAHDLDPTLRASYTLGYWRNRSDGRAATYLRDAAGLPVATGPIHIDGLDYAAAGGAGAGLTAADFPLTREGLEHLMHAVSLRRHARQDFDWELALSRYDYHHDLLRRSGTPLPDAAVGGPGTLTDMRGTGWHALAWKGTWRPNGAPGLHTVDLGLQQENFELDTKVYGTSDWLHGGPAALASVFGGRSRLRSAYAQDTWALAPDWKAVLGDRLEAWDAWGGVTAGAAGAFAHPPRGERHVSPKVALAHEPEPHWVLKASAGRAVRMPTVSELFQGSVGSAGSLSNGDPHLRPEKSWTGEISSEWHLAEHQWRVTLFHETTRDALITQTNVTVSPSVTNVQNVDRVRTNGAELSWQGPGAPAGSVDAAASLTYADSRILRNEKFPASEGRRQPRVPLWRAHLLATWRPAPAWSATLGARYSGEQFSTLDNTDTHGFAYQGTSRFFTADLRVVYRASPRWSAALGIDNLNNDLYWNFHPYPRRTFSLELRLDL